MRMLFIHFYFEIVEIRNMTTTYYILTTQSVIILELVRIQLGFSSDMINYLHYLSVTI